MIHQTLTIKESEAVRQIRSAVMRYGKTPSIRELMSALGYRSPRSASVIIDNLARKGVLKRKFDGKFQLVRAENNVAHAQTIDVPLVGAAACGAPILAQENIEAMIPVSVQLAKAPYKYFLLKARGDSMDEKGIKDGDFVLVRQQSAAENGDTVVALIDNEAAIKEFYKTSSAVILKPRSKNKAHQPIILTTNFQIQGIVAAAIPNF